MVSEFLDIRLQAAHALSGIASAKLNTTVLDSQIQLMSSAIHSFIDAQYTQQKNAKSGAVTLPDVLAACVQLHGQPLHPSEGAPWALVVLASIIILSDSSLFSVPRSLRLCLATVRHIHHGGPMSRLRAHIWLCLVWALSRLTPSGSEKEKSARDAALLMVMQELNFGIGIALAGVLLSPDNKSLYTAPLSKLASTANDMVRSRSYDTRRDGARLLMKLLGGLGAGHPVHTMESIVAQDLFTGKLLHDVWDQVVSVVKSLPPPGIDLVRPLADDEILSEWESLLAIWAHTAESFLKPERSWIPLVRRVSKRPQLLITDALC